METMFRKKKIVKKFVCFSFYHNFYISNSHSLSVSLPQINLMKNESLFNVLGQIINANYLEKIINVVSG